jgi:hypothetical protein
MLDWQLRAKAGPSARYPHSKAKNSADLLKDLPYGAAVVAVEKEPIESIKKSQGSKRCKCGRRRSQQWLFSAPRSCQMYEARGPYGLFDRDFYARPSIDSDSIHHPTPQLIGVNKQMLIDSCLIFDHQVWRQSRVAHCIGSFERDADPVLTEPNDAAVPYHSIFLGHELKSRRKK